MIKKYWWNFAGGIVAGVILLLGPTLFVFSKNSDGSLNFVGPDPWWGQWATPGIAYILVFASVFALSALPLFFKKKVNFFFLIPSFLFFSLGFCAFVLVFYSTLSLDINIR